MPEERENAEEKALLLECADCGHVAPFAEWVDDDPGDTRCPKCGCDEHVMLI